MNRRRSRSGRRSPRSPPRSSPRRPTRAPHYERERLLPEAPRGRELAAQQEQPRSPPPLPWQYPGYGAPGFPTHAAFPPGYGWPDWHHPQADGVLEKKKKKKKKKKRDDSSSSSSSSSNLSDWRQKVWNRQWQGQMGNMWPHMPGGPSQGAHMWGWPHPMGCGGGPPAWPPPPTGDEACGHSAPSGCGSHRGRPAQSRGGDRGFDGWGERGEERERREEPPEDVPIFLEPAVEEFVPVPKALLGKVIGKQAQTIIEIREKSGAFKVDARDQTSDPCQVKVAGTAEAVKKARALIMEMVESTKNKHAGSDFVEIPRAKIGMVIGLKGSQVNEIQNQTGTKIDVDFDADPCKCYIKGPQDCVSKAKKVLLTIAMQIEDDNSEYVDLPKATSGALIGAQGSRVREFQEQSGARIDVDKTGPRCRVRLTGTLEQIANAKQLILAEVENALPSIVKPPPTPALMASAQQPMVIPAHQPTSFPATLSESIARAKAAAEAVKNGLITSPGAGILVSIPPPPPPAAVTPSQLAWTGQSQGSIAGMGVLVPPPAQLPGGAGSQPYRPW